MEFTPRTVEIIKNFAHINSGLVFPQGNTLFSLCKKKVRAKAIIAGEIEKDFAIADLQKFIGVLRLFKEPKVRIGEHTLILSEEERTVEYVFADPRLIDAPSEQEKKDINFRVDVSFYLASKILRELQGAASTFQHTEMIVIGEKGGVYLETRNVENVTSDRYRVLVGETPHVFCMAVPMDSLTKVMLQEDYHVEAGFDRIIRLKKGNELEYLLAVDARGTVVPDMRAA